MDILAGLNPEQLAAVTAEERQVLVIAGAGSGKTRVLVSRIAWLIAVRGVSPYGLMAVTFTNRAANEMKDRVEAMTGIQSRWMWIGTFHALAARLLRMEGDHFGIGRDFVIYDDGDSRTLIKRILAGMNLGAEEKQFHPSAVAAAISEAKNKLVAAADYSAYAEDEWQRTVGQVYLRYQTALKANRALDFDDLLTQAVWNLERYPEIRARYCERFRHILVDEYQDTNHCQYRLVRLLAGEEGHLFAVGDPDQSIYRWRGADINNILDFSRDYPACRELKLTQNYRSTQNILSAANALIAHNLSRKPKDLFTTAGDGAPVGLHRTETDREEAAYVIRAVAALQDEGYALDDCAVLYRTHGQSRLFEDECIRFGIPYRIYGGMKFYERKEVKDTLAYLRLLVNPYDGEALRRIYNEPRRGIGKATWDKLQEIAERQGRAIWDLLADCADLEASPATRNRLKGLYQLLAGMIADTANIEAVAEIIRLVWERTGYADAIAAAGDEERLEILEQLLDTASGFDLSYDMLSLLEAEEAPERPLLAFLSQVSLATDMDAVDADRHKLTLMTLHAAKGLEYPVVFLVGMEEGIFPHKKVIFSFDDGQMEEERRLCYVGMTRARERLQFTAASRRLFWGNYETNKNSRFLAEIPDHLLLKSGVAPPGQRQKPAPGMRATTNLFKPQVPAAAPKPTVALVAVGDRLRHSKFGDGVVVAVSGGGDDLQVQVAFPDQGIKNLMLKYAPVKKI